MPFEVVVLSIDRDDRLGSYCVTAQCSYASFLDITAEAETSLSIQRAVIKGTRAYGTLRADLKRGCVLPPIVLAANCTLQQPIAQTFENREFDRLQEDLGHIQRTDVYVIDGLQRTNALRQTLDELEGAERDVFLARRLRIELWVNVSFGAIAYRMLLLNAGQRPMSVKHQVEVLSSKLIDDLSDIPQLDIFRVSDTRRRTQPGQFSLAKIAQGFQAWLQGQPNLDLRNTVMEELLADSAVEVLGQAITGNAGTDNEGDGFHKIMTWIVRLDAALGINRVAFLGNDTVLLGLCAAIGAMEKNSSMAPRVWPALERLLRETETNQEQDIVGVGLFDTLRSGTPVSKLNVGVATREMVFNAFKEFIRHEGEISMNECWQSGAANI